MRAASVLVVIRRPPHRDHRRTRALHSRRSPTRGAAGVHLGSYRLIRDGKLDVRKPEILIYVPTDTDYRLVAIEYVVPDTGQQAPSLFGQTFSRFDASNTPGFKAARPPVGRSSTGS